MDGFVMDAYECMRPNDGIWTAHISDGSQELDHGIMPGNLETRLASENPTISFSSKGWK